MISFGLVVCQCGRNHSAIRIGGIHRATQSHGLCRATSRGAMGGMVSPAHPLATHLTACMVGIPKQIGMLSSGGIFDVFGFEPCMFTS